MIPENRRQWVNSCRKIERMLFGLMNIWLIVIVIVQAWFWWVSSEWLEEREIEGETVHLKCAIMYGKNKNIKSSKIRT